jgi:predicted SAM-dependent methyltransferase
MKFYQYLTTIISFFLKPKKRKLIQLSYKLKDKIGLEIGGPSSFFKLKSYFPVYLFARQIDGVNFSNETVWEGNIEEGKNYQYATNKQGYQHICEASGLENIPSESYDFLLSCHSLEHVANPVKALKNWHRVLKRSGKIILILPDKNYTFDIQRPYTTFEHLLDDFNNDVDEHDDTHFEEILQLHKIEMDSGTNNFEELKSRTKNNFVNRCVHHHVYDLPLLEKLLTHCNFKIIHQQKAAPFHLVIVGEKIDSNL